MSVTVARALMEPRVMMLLMDIRVAVRLVGQAITARVIMMNVKVTHAKMVQSVTTVRTHTHAVAVMAG